MFFSLAEVEVGTHLYWNIAGLTVHGQVLIVTWLVIAILLGVAVVGTQNMQQVQKLAAGSDCRVGNKARPSRVLTHLAECTL